MFGKIVAISTVKHLSRNYASFQQPSVQEWYSLSTSGQAQSIPQRNTADFHGDGYILQNTGLTKDLRIAFVVCDVNSEKEQLQVKIFVLKKCAVDESAEFAFVLRLWLVGFLIWEQIFSYEPLK